MVGKLKMRLLKERKLLQYAFLFTILFFGVNFVLEYATDTYAVFTETDSWEWMLYGNGRVFNALIYYVIEKLGIPNGYVYKLSYLAAVIFLTMAVYIFSRLLLDYCEDQRLCSAAAFMTIANFYVIDYFLFIEKGLFMFAILLCTAAVCFTADYFKKGRRGLLLQAFLCLMVAVFIYQIMLGLYAVLCLPFILKYSRDARQFLKYNVVTAFLYAVPLVSAFMVTKIFFGSERAGMPGNFFSNLKLYIPKILQLSTEKWFHIPANMLFAFWTMTVVFAALLFLFHRKDPADLKRENGRLSNEIKTPCEDRTASERKMSQKQPAAGGESCRTGSFVLHRKQKNGICFLGSFLYLTAGTVFIAFFPAFSGISGDFAARIIYPYGCMPGVLCLWLFMEYDLKHPGKYQYVMGGIILVILSSQYLIFQSVFIDRYKGNEADRYYCEIVGNAIREYESEHNTVVDTICFYKDKSLRWYEWGLEESGMAVRAMSCGWSNIASLNIYLDSDYRKGDPLPEYEEYFSEQNWDTYSSKQLIFEENVLHLCVY